MLPIVYVHLGDKPAPSGAEEAAFGGIKQYGSRREREAMPFV